MRLSLRLFLGYFFLVAVTGQLVLLLVVKQISPGVRMALEASLVDTANLLAELAAPELARGNIADGQFADAVRRYSKRPVSATIFGFPKQSLDYRVYVTDATGVVRFDSAGTAVGENYSRWNDVYLTLQGRYGARSSQADPDDKRSSTMHVAAPVRDGETLIGVVTVAYPTALLQPIVEAGKSAVQRGAFWLFGGALLFGAIFNWRLTRAIELLVAYARTVTSGGKATPPKLHSVELATLAQTLETMRRELEGKQYVERYVQTLTHEMKSPLAAIRGAAELLEEPLPDADRLRFAGNAREQAERLDQLIERLLGLAAVEQRQHLAEPRILDLAGLVTAVAAEKAAPLAQQRLRFALDFAGELPVLGEEFLLRQAVSNLLDNALAFAPAESAIEIRGWSENQQARLRIRDHGPGIPAYALARLFERFYSLPRPATGRKSTGLGLAFVREVAALHGGEIRVANAEGGGAAADLSLPLSLRPLHV
ncbi:two-component system sensor histidine kinase CreC [Methylomonas koyamae]|uniref:histidine kinase n=1 Tax=Methylomonas koyamae TaxID=702114 RepID=A0A291IIL3_9GAMM|nr:two-component system sensor histidine kinase CreC [Methylomonas koyamae]ATG90010.1 histidine kinase [Methylomonas koyamae]OAI24474.1 two-component sensor histidine kinase [Methylomonas koyamae]